jgi:UDP-N-acetylglucosamine 2-epimerase (non-hydrolysing)
MAQLYRKHIYFFVGTTTELVRVTPIIKELKKRHIPYKIIASGQNKIHLDHIRHYVKDIQIDLLLKEKGNKSSIFRFVTWSFLAFFIGMFKLRKEFRGLNKNNSHFIIYGDPVSTSIGAIIAKMYNLHIVHVESGDFSFDLREPFPEEVCRNINVWLADVLFPPSSWAINNLKKKGVTKKIINTYYNMQLEVFQQSIKTKPSKALQKTLKQLDNYYILIMHRQEHVFFKKDWTARMLKFIIENSPKDVKCVMFDHPLSMQIVESIKPQLSKKLAKNITTLPLLSYSDFLHFMKNSEYLASDSATNQYETYMIGKPYLSLRDKTEQIEGINENVVLAKGDESIMQEFLLNYKRYKRKRVIPQKVPSKIIVDYLEKH